MFAAPRTAGLSEVHDVGEGEGEGEGYHVPADSTPAFRHAGDGPGTLSRYRHTVRCIAMLFSCRAVRL